MTPRRIVNRLRRTIFGTLYVDRGGGPEDTVFLGGSGRSGTTWLSEVINFDNSYRYLFEPFHPRYVPQWSGFPERPYLRPTEEHKEALETARQILSGRIRNRWIDGFNTKLVGHRRLLKDVRANLFLKWLSAHFPEVPIVFALRHPCAVVLSQHRGQRLRESWPPDLQSLLDQPALVEDHLGPFVPYIREACSMDLFDQLVFRWCIENYVPLRQFEAGGLHCVFYERVCLEPEAEIRRLFESIGRRWDVAALRTASRASPMTAQESRIHSAPAASSGLIDGWVERIEPVRVERTVEILALFGLDRFYGTEPEPLATPAPTWSGSPRRATSE